MFIKVPIPEATQAALMALVDDARRVTAAHDVSATEILYIAWWGPGNRMASATFDGRRRVTTKASSVRASAVTEALSGFDWAGSEGLATYFFAESP